MYHFEQGHPNDLEQGVPTKMIKKIHTWRGSPITYNTTCLKSWI